MKMIVMRVAVSDENAQEVLDRFCELGIDCTDHHMTAGDITEPTPDDEKRVREDGCWEYFNQSIFVYIPPTQPPAEHYQ